MNAEHNGRPATFVRDHTQRVEVVEMPQRAKRLVEAMCALSDHWLEPTLRLCLDRFDKSLYDRADNSRNHLEQQRFFDSRNQLQQGRGAFTHAFSARLRESFSKLGYVDDKDASHDLSMQSMALVERSEQELTAALDKLASRGEAHNNALLSELSYRLAVLVGSPPLEGKSLPPGPQNLARILRVASEPLNLQIEHRLLLLQAFEQSVNNALGSLYEGINATLLADGILPRLHVFPAPRTVNGPAHTPPTTATATPEAATAGAATHSAGTERSEPIAVLETLRDLLSHQRAPQGRRGGVDDGGRTATPDELQTALSALQQHVAQVTDNTTRELRSAKLLQEELLTQLNAGVPMGSPRMQLSAEQGDTVELVAMLFDQLSAQLHHGPDARSLLGTLQVPLLRMAVTDRDFFDQREHPARRMLGTLAEAINDWLKGPDGEIDHQLLAKLSHLVDRTQHETPSAGLYTSLLADIEHHMAQLSRKAQSTERRHIEALQGREKLELSRRRADQLINERFAIASPRGLLRTLMERAWSDVLALNLLRHGEESEAFVQCMRVTDQLLGQFPVCDTALLRHEVETGLQQIGMHAEEAEQVARRLIGTDLEATPPVPTASPIMDTLATEHEDVAVPSAVIPIETVADAPTTVAAHAATPMTPAAEASAPLAFVAPIAAVEPPSATDLAVRLKQRQRLGEHPGNNATHAAVVPPLGLREARIHNRLRQTGFGTWFEFTDPKSGEQIERKLAWFSPVSGNSLFVNRRGQRSDVMNLQELARGIANGQVREIAHQDEKLLDRAWRVIANNLRRPVAVPTPESRP